MAWREVRVESNERVFILSQIFSWQMLRLLELLVELFFFSQNVCGLSPFDLLWIRLNVTNAATAGVVAP